MKRFVQLYRRNCVYLWTLFFTTLHRTNFDMRERFFPLFHQSSIQCITKSDSSPACCCSACAWPCTRNRTRGAPPPRPPRRSCRTCASAAYTELEEPVTGRKSHLGIMRMWFEQSQQGSTFLQSSRVKKVFKKERCPLVHIKPREGNCPKKGYLEIEIASQSIFLTWQIWSWISMKEATFAST